MGNYHEQIRFYLQTHSTLESSRTFRLISYWIRLTVDWRMIFPDHSVAMAFSRIVEADEDHCVFSFILMPPPAPLEQLEGALEAQSRTLSKELKQLKILLEKHG